MRAHSPLSCRAEPVITRDLGIRSGMVRNVKPIEEETDRMTAQTSEEAVEHAPQPRIVPCVSVVIPSYRGGRFLREAVASVQLQTLRDWEIIIVLDGCEDDLSDVEDSGSRMRIVRQRRRGASIARNVGIGHPRSDLIAFLDDDDRMLPDRLAVQVEVMKDKNIGLCHTEWRDIDENGEPKLPDGAQYRVRGGSGEPRPFASSRQSQYREYLRGETAVALSSVMVRKSIIQELGGFNPLLPQGEDLDFVYRIARENGIRFVPDVLTEYRRHGDNTWTESTTTGEMKLVLMQHVFVTKSRGEAENLRAARTGLTNLVSGRATFAMRRAREAQLRHDYVGVAIALAQSFLSSPRGSFRATWKVFRRDILGSRSVMAFIHTRINIPWGGSAGRHGVPS